MSVAIPEARPEAAAHLGPLLPDTVAPHCALATTKARRARLPRLMDEGERGNEHDQEAKAREEHRRAECDEHEHEAGGESENRSPPRSAPMMTRRLRADAISKSSIVFVELLFHLVEDSLLLLGKRHRHPLSDSQPCCTNSIIPHGQGPNNGAGYRAKLSDPTRKTVGLDPDCRPARRDGPRTGPTGRPPAA